MLEAYESKLSALVSREVYIDLKARLKTQSCQNPAQELKVAEISWCRQGARYDDYK